MDELTAFNLQSHFIGKAQRNIGEAADEARDAQKIPHTKYD